jgi:hypothetical protein
VSLCCCTGGQQAVNLPPTAAAVRSAECTAWHCFTILPSSSEKTFRKHKCHKAERCLVFYIVKYNFIFDNFGKRSFKAA